MDFNLSREHQLIRKMMAEFTEREVKPIAAETDRTCEYPRDNIEKLFNLGVMGMCVPKEYGGAGADPLASALCIEELSKQCASTGDIVFQDCIVPKENLLGVKGEGKRYTKQAAMAKLFCSEHAMKTTTKALQMFGGYGYTKDYPVERMMRDAKITEIYEGTSEVQRIVISANMGL